MADNDIYNNKGRYKSFIKRLNKLCIAPDKKKDKGKRKKGKRKYWIKNKKNKKYFLKLHKKFEAKDLSYIRRMRLFNVLKIICFVIEKDLREIKDRKEIDKITAFSHKVNKSRKSKRDFAIDIKYIWKMLFPEKDERGRADETIVPYIVRHVSAKIPKSKEKLRGDRLSLEEFEKLVQGFSDDSRIQCLLTLIQESLGRPQEVLGRRIKDVELHDNYAKIYISEHGKAGTGFLRVIDSYFYLAKWMNEHPLRSDPDSWLFLNLGNRNRHKQMKPAAANKLIRQKCKELKINKPVTLYSFKRNGITHMRLKGASDLDIQHTARWTSTKQLKTYDLSTQEESFKIELIKRGKIKAKDKYAQFQPTSKKCVFCGTENGIAESVCSKCKRPLDREAIERESKEREEKIKEIESKMDEMVLMFERKIQKAIAATQQ